MDLNTSEFDHITDRLTDAMTRPLMKRIEELEGENKELHEVLEKANHTMAVQTLALNGAQQKIARLEAELARLHKAEAVPTMTALMYQQYIPLSKPATQDYVLHLAEGRDVMFVAHFLQHTLPADAPPQLAEEVKQMTCLPKPVKEASTVVNNTFGQGSSAQVFNSDVNHATFENPKQERL